MNFLLLVRMNLFFASAADSRSKLRRALPQFRGAHFLFIQSAAAGL